MKFPSHRAVMLLLSVAGLWPIAMPGQESVTTPAEEKHSQPFDFARQLELLNAGRREGQGGRGFGELQSALIEQAVRTDPRAAAQTILEKPGLVMVDDWWLINVQALFRLWGAADLPAMTEWVKAHPLDPKLQPAADYALFQHQVDGLAEGEMIALWQRQLAAARHWAKRDVASIIASSDPRTALERLARQFPTAGERGEMMSLALDMVARKHPRTLLPWLEDLAPFFYNEPEGSVALFRLPADEVATALRGLTDQARAMISLEYMRQCLIEDDRERAGKLVEGVTVEPYKSLIEKEFRAATKSVPTPPD